MRPRLVALGCTFAGALGFLALPPATAGAASLPKPGISVTTAASYAYGTKVKVTVTLKDRIAGAKVSLYATPAGGKRTLVATGKVNSAGKLSPAYTVTKATKFTAVFGGDAKDAPASASRTTAVLARVAAGQVGFFKTAKIGRITYGVYHGTSTLTLTAAVLPNKHGECLEPETEQAEVGTTWGADTKYGCDSLTEESHDTAPFTVNLAVGDRYRIRGDYVRAAKDLGNLSEQGPWLYFEVVK
jgi:hypothetical protein